MNEKLIVVLLLITIILSIVSMAIVFNLPTIGLENFIATKSSQSQSGTATVGFEIVQGPGGTG